MFPARTLWNFDVLTHLGREGCIWFFFAFSLTPPPLQSFCIFPPTSPEFSQQSLCFCYCPLAFMGWGRSLTLSLAGDPETEVSSPILQRLWLQGPERGPLARLPPFCPACCSWGLPASLTQRWLLCLWTQLHLTEFSSCVFSATALCLVQRYWLSLPGHLHGKWAFVLQKGTWWGQIKGS